MSHGHGGGGQSSSEDMNPMAIAFQNSQFTSLYSAAWTTTSPASYAGSCIFLLVLAIVNRLLLASKTAIERRWVATALARRYIFVAGQTPESERIDQDPDAKAHTLISAQGVEEKVKVVRRTSRGPIPWRFSADLPRALLLVVIMGVTYLLMLAVMTLNVGYFLSVLAGFFIGELAVGRYIAFDEH